MKERLFNQMELALKDKNYAEALKIINKLLKNQIHSRGIYVTKLNCLIQLKQFDEAEQFCEDLLEFTADFYEYYFEYYLFILFELNKFHILMDAYEAARKANKINKEKRVKLYSFY